jgi:hypothetical protein
MDLHQALQEKRFDVRLTERNLQSGVIQAQDLEKMRKDLPDLSSNTENLNLENANNSDRFNT